MELMELVHEDPLSQIANSGVPLLAWNELRPLVEQGILTCISNFCAQHYIEQNNDISEKTLHIVQLLHTFDHDAPFTIQRICELILQPHHPAYSLPALLQAFHVLLSVTSTVSPGTPRQVQNLRVKIDGLKALDRQLPRSSTVEL